MSQKPDYKRGYDDAMRAAVTWLHDRAKEMNDPHAKQILDSAATNLGWAHQHTIPSDRTVTLKPVIGSDGQPYKET